MLRCDCCEAAIPDTSLRLICPPCADSLRVAMNTPHLTCMMHAKAFSMAEWDNQPVRTHG